MTERTKLMQTGTIERMNTGTARANARLDKAYTRRLESATNSFSLGYMSSRCGLYLPKEHTTRFPWLGHHWTTGNN